MSAPYESITGRIARLLLWQPPPGIGRYVGHDQDEPARPPVVVLTYGTSRLKVTVEDDVAIAEVYRALDQYAAILRRRHRETRQLFQARYTAN